MTEFGWHSTTDQVLEGIDLSGKLALVTGISSGLGLETARALCAHGAEVIGAVRDVAKGTAATRQIKSDYNGRLTIVELNLARLASVRELAERILADQRRIDLIICNAGVMATPFEHTADGFELQFGTNHLGHFLLVNRIAPLLAPGSRVISLSSAGHALDDIHFDDINFTQRRYDPILAYGAAKTANVLFAVEFDRRHKGRDIRAAAVHPGGIMTELARYMSKDVIDRMISLMRQEYSNSSSSRGYKSLPQGAATSVWAAVTAPADLIGGRYCEDCHVAPVSSKGEGVRPYAVNSERAKMLWKISEDLIAEQFPAMKL
jgi:NAD(P)-dependent dehydrogenase (short-subunit alcohol dehydrogenase family)